MSYAQPGEVWQRFSNLGNFVKVLAVARDVNEPAKQVVVYQCLYGHFEIWAIPVEAWAAEFNIVNARVL